jgi:hypothetical protein
MADERCELMNNAVRAGNLTEDILRRVNAIDAARIDRLLLASLNDDPEARQFAMNEFPACQDCYRGIMIQLAGECAALWETYFESDEDHPSDETQAAARDRAIEMISNRLVKNLDAQAE